MNVPVRGRPDGVDAVVADILGHRDRDWAWENFLPSVRNLIVASGARQVIEIGGGRSPSFSQNDLQALGIEYTSNDISARELDKAPAWVGKAHFDIAAADPAMIAPFEGTFDVAFSKMVMEHVGNFHDAYRNIHRILTPGGLAIAFHPVLYAVPFVINRMIPETVSQPLLAKLFPDRTDEGTPKFPAWYSGCFVSQRVRDSLRAIGFADVWQAPFYGHRYYRKIPIVRDIHKLVTRQLSARNVATLASFAYTIVRK